MQSGTGLLMLTWTVGLTFKNPADDRRGTLQTRSTPLLPCFYNITIYEGWYVCGLWYVAGTWLQASGQFGATAFFPFWDYAIRGGDICDNDAWTFAFIIWITYISNRTQCRGEGAPQTMHRFLEKRHECPHTGLQKCIIIIFCRKKFGLKLLK